MVLSPITKKPNVQFIEKISVGDIVKGYQTYNVSVSRIFNEHEYVSKYLCLDSGLRFFIPLDIEGDGQFYEELEANEWYYNPWKWEHKVALKLVEPGFNVLEIGSGDGGFLDRLSQISTVNCMGLELNSRAVKACRERGLDVKEELIQEHAENNREKYDIVCSFQVQEHISDVESFIEAQVSCLKRGGALIVSVPNNGSFIARDKKNVLNMPPHHMLLWDLRSLTYLEKKFELKIKKVCYEPLQRYHFRWYVNLFAERLPWLARKIYIHLRIRNIHVWSLKYFSRFIKGHSILLVYHRV